MLYLPCSKWFVYVVNGLVGINITYDITVNSYKL